MVAEINRFRRLHQASDVSVSKELNQLANQWAIKIAQLGEEKKNPVSKYGQLVCSQNGGELAKDCTVGWYGSIQFFDWADPKITEKASPFTQMVWKNNKFVGVGIGKRSGDSKKQNVGAKSDYIVVRFDPGQDAKAKVKENVLPVAGQFYIWPF